MDVADTENRVQEILADIEGVAAGENVPKETMLARLKARDEAENAELRGVLASTKAELAKATEIIMRLVFDLDSELTDEEKAYAKTLGAPEAENAELRGVLRELRDVADGDAAMIARIRERWHTGYDGILASETLRHRDVRAMLDAYDRIVTLSPATEPRHPAGDNGEVSPAGDSGDEPAKGKEGGDG